MSIDKITVEKDWITAAGYRAVVTMNNIIGCRCGYVGVPTNHALDLPEDTSFHVHGDITYYGNGKHFASDGLHLMWYGFDCAHAGDAPSPEFLEQIDNNFGELYSYNALHGVHRSLVYCIAECEDLARQLMEAQ